MKVHLDGCLVEHRLGSEELSVAVAEGLQHQWQLAPEDLIAPTGSAQNDSAAHVTVHVKRQAVCFLSLLGQHLVPHQAGVPTRHLLAVVVQADGEEQIARGVGVGQCVAPARHRSCRCRAVGQLNVQFLGLQASHVLFFR